MSEMAQAMVEQQRQPFVPASGLLQRKCDKCRKKKQLLHRRSAGQVNSDLTIPLAPGLLGSLDQTPNRVSSISMDPDFGHDFGRLPIHALSLTDGETIGMQAKLAVNQPGDKYEKEADRVADKVLGMDSPFNLVGLQGSAWSRCNNQRMHPMKEDMIIQGGPIPVKNYIVPHDQESRIMSIIGSGQPLLANTRAFFEPRFGYDFSKIRIHTDSEASQMSKALAAQAFTYGNDIYFGSGSYDPDSNEGKRLLAHELTHVVQQTANSSFSPDITQLQGLDGPDSGEFSDNSEPSSPSDESVDNETTDFTIPPELKGKTIEVNQPIDLQDIELSSEDLKQSPEYNDFGEEPLAPDSEPQSPKVAMTKPLSEIIQRDDPGLGVEMGANLTLPFTFYSSITCKNCSMWEFQGLLGKAHAVTDYSFQFMWAHLPDQGPKVSFWQQKAGQMAVTAYTEQIETKNRQFINGLSFAMIPYLQFPITPQAPDQSTKSGVQAQAQARLIQLGLAELDLTGTISAEIEIPSTNSDAAKLKFPPNASVSFIGTF